MNLMVAFPVLVEQPIMNEVKDSSIVKMTVMSDELGNEELSTYQTTIQRPKSIVFTLRAVRYCYSLKNSTQSHTGAHRPMYGIVGMVIPLDIYIEVIG